MIHVLVLLLPLGLDTLGLSLSLGMKGVPIKYQAARSFLRFWLPSVLFFAGLEMLMPLVGLAIGYALSREFSETLRIVGPLLLIGIGLWELIGECREMVGRCAMQVSTPATRTPLQVSSSARLSRWIKPLLLALSISMDELIVGFSLGSVTALAIDEKNISVFVLCLFIGLQGGLMTIIGLIIGRLLGSSTSTIKQWNEWLAGLLLIGLGAWLLLYKR